MNLLKSAAAALAITTFLGPVAFAEREVVAGPMDHRIKTVNYAERDVVAIHGHYGFSTTIEFAVNETVLTVSIGDSEAWQVVKPKQPNLLFIKPIEPEAATNMSVVTDKRIYVFMLEAHRARSKAPHDMTFHVKFRYPSDASAMMAYQARERERLEKSIGSAAKSPDEWNFDYTYSGVERLRPTRTFDDGKFTYFSFSDFENVPAIFMVNADGSEAIVNYQQQGQYLVVERLARQFTLRDGPEATCIFNESFPATIYDEAAPKPATVSAFETVEPTLSGGPRNIPRQSGEAAQTQALRDGGS